MLCVCFNWLEDSADCSPTRTLADGGVISVSTFVVTSKTGIEMRQLTHWPPNPMQKKKKKTRIIARNSWWHPPSPATLFEFKSVCGPAPLSVIAPPPERFNPMFGLSRFARSPSFSSPKTSLNFSCSYQVLGFGPLHSALIHEGAHLPFPRALFGAIAL